MLKNENFEYTVTAISPCKYYIINDAAISKLVKDHPEIALEFQTALCRIIFDENQSTVEELAKKNENIIFATNERKNLPFDQIRLTDKKLSIVRSAKVSYFYRILRKLPSSLLPVRNLNENESENENENENGKGTENHTISVDAKSVIEINISTDDIEEKNERNTNFQRTNEISKNKTIKSNEL